MARVIWMQLGKLFIADDGGDGASAVERILDGLSDCDFHGVDCVGEGAALSQGAEALDGALDDCEASDEARSLEHRLHFSQSARVGG